MSSVHYKFRSSLEYDTLSFDGPSISLNELRDAIMVQKKIGKNSDFTLEVTNAQTKEVYQDLQSQIPRNTSVVVKRVPIARLAAVTGKTIDPESKEDAESGKVSLEQLTQTGDLANANASENDKIAAMMKQSGELFQPDQYVNNKIRPGAGYICFRCGKPGHYIRNCPTIGDPRFNTPRYNQRAPNEYYILQMKEREKLASLKATAAAAPNRSFSPVVSSDGHSAKEIPTALQCPMCKKLLNDAVVIPCCGTSYCDECIRNYLMDNDFSCHSCKEKTLPDNIIPNKSLRKAVENFKTTSHLATTTSSQTATPTTAAVDTTVKTENTLVETKPKISITLLKRSEPKPKEIKEEPKSPEDDKLNTSVGPLTEAQLFEQIVKDNEKKKEEDEKKATDNEIDASKETEKDDESPSSVKPTTESGATNADEAKSPDTSNGIVEKTEDTASADQSTVTTSLPQVKVEPSVQDAQAVTKSQQQQQQLQLQQQQLQLQQLQAQQQLNAQRGQMLDQVQLQPGGLMAADGGVLLQPSQQPLASMSMVSNMNPALAAQLVNVSGAQLLGPSLSSVAAVSQGLQQRLIVPGLSTHLNHMANLGPSVVHPSQPVVGLSMASAFAPDSIHSVLPKMHPAGVVNAHLGRSNLPTTTNRMIRDQLIDIGQANSKSLPMSEEEFYRMKIKLKDSQRSRRKRSTSRSPLRSDSYRSRKDGRHGERSRSRDRKRSRDSHKSRDKNRHSKERSESRSKSYKYRERDRQHRSSPRPEEYLKRKKKEKLSVLLQDYDSFDEVEEEVVGGHRSGKRHHESGSRSRSKTFSPEHISGSRDTNSRSSRKSNESWSRSPTPEARGGKLKSGKDEHDFSGEEFETVKLEEPVKMRNELQPPKHKKSQIERKSSKTKEGKSRKRKSDGSQNRKELNIKRTKEDVPLVSTELEEEVIVDRKVKKKMKLEKRKNIESSSRFPKDMKTIAIEKADINIDKKSSDVKIIKPSDVKLDNSSVDVKTKISKKKKQVTAPEKKKIKKVKVKKVKKQNILVVTPEVEVKTAKKLVDVSSSQTESEMETKMKVEETTSGLDADRTDECVKSHDAMEESGDTGVDNADADLKRDVDPDVDSTQPRSVNEDKSVHESEAVSDSCPATNEASAQDGVDTLMKSIDDALNEGADLDQGNCLLDVTVRDMVESANDGANNGSKDVASDGADTEVGKVEDKYTDILTEEVNRTDNDMFSSSLTSAEIKLTSSVSDVTSVEQSIDNEPASAIVFVKNLELGPQSHEDISNSESEKKNQVGVEREEENTLVHSSVTDLGSSGTSKEGGDERLQPHAVVDGKEATPENRDGDFVVTENDKVTDNGGVFDKRGMDDKGKESSGNILEDEETGEHKAVTDVKLDAVEGEVAIEMVTKTDEVSDHQWREDKGFDSEEGSVEGTSSQKDNSDSDEMEKGEDVAEDDSDDDDDSEEEDDEDDDDDVEKEEEEEKSAGSEKSDVEGTELSVREGEDEDEAQVETGSEVESDNEDGSISEAVSEDEQSSEVSAEAEARVENKVEYEEEEEVETDDDETSDDDGIEEEEKEESSDELAREEEEILSSAKSSKNSAKIIDNGTEDSVMESDSEEEEKRSAKKKKRKKEKRKREKSKKKKKRDYLEDGDEDSDNLDESEEEEERKQRKRKKSEKKSKKQKRKHKKRSKHSKKHRKSSKKYDESEEDADSAFEKERKRQRKKRKSEDFDSESESPVKYIKVSKSDRRDARESKQSKDYGRSGKIVVDLGDLKRKGGGKVSRTVYVERDNDIRKVESKKRTKVSRTVRT